MYGEKLDGNYTRMLQAIFNKSWRQHPTKQQLSGHQPPITKTIQVRRARHARHCWRRKDKLIRDVLLWIPSHGQVKAGRPVGTYIQQLCADIGCSLEDLPESMDDRERWLERVRDIRVGGVTGWWWWAQRMRFLHDRFQMTAIALVSVINHYHINGLHLFWDTLYIYRIWVL